MDSELRELLTDIKQSLKHPYLMLHIQEPSIDEDKLMVFHELFKRSERNEIHKYIKPLTLIQAALDTHERVKVDSLEERSGHKSRQLTVLAGDYYSSLYYYLLAKVKDSVMIRAVADGIEKINEAKMSFYKNESDWSALLAQLKTIDSGLLVRICHVLNLEEWTSTIKNYFYLKRLTEEKQFILNGKASDLVGQLIRHRPQLKQTALGAIEREMSELRLELTLLADQPSRQFIRQLASYDWVMANSYNKKTIAEEG